MQTILYSKSGVKKTSHAHLERFVGRSKGLKPIFRRDMQWCEFWENSSGSLNVSCFLSVWLTLSCDSPNRAEQFYQTDNMKENSVFPHLLLTWTDYLSLFPFSCCFHLLRWCKKAWKVRGRTERDRYKQAEMISTHGQVYTWKRHL